ncbi:MAG: phage tail tape measure protein, partial [Actinobacteria bacterium]
MPLSFSVFNKFKAIDGVTAPIRRMEKNVGKFGKTATKAFKQADRASSRFGKKLRSVGNTMSTRMTLPLTILGGVAVKTAIDFESAFTGVRKTVNATEKEFSSLKKQLTDMSREIPVATSEIFGIAEAAGQLGIKTKDIASFTKVIADLKATTNLEEPAADLARFANITDIASNDFGRLGSTIVDLGNNFATTESEIVEMSMRLGAAGKLVKLSAAETLGLSAALTSVGIKAEAGGTAFSQVMIKINKEIGTGSKKMAGFAKVSGVSVKQFEKMWKDDTASALLSFIEGLKKTQNQGKNVNRVLDGLGFSGIRISDALLRAAGSGDLFRKAMNLGNDAWKENTALTKEATLRYGTSASKLAIFKNKVTILASTFGNILIPVLIKVVDSLTPMLETFEKLNPNVKTAILVAAGIAAALGPVIVAVGLLTTAMGALMAVSAPVWLILGVITLALAGIGAAIYQVVKHWENLKMDFFIGIGKIGKFFSGLGGVQNIAQSGQTAGPISPNAGLAQTIRTETENRSKVSFYFSNLPQG